MRIASLLPAATEIVAALGRADDLVAVTYECDHPVGIADGRAVVVDTVLPPDLTPGRIDAVVRDRARRGLPLYELDTVALTAAAPDLVLTQDLCRVCALPAGAVTEALALVGGARPAVVVDDGAGGRVDGSGDDRPGGAGPGGDAVVVLSVDPHSIDDVLAAIGEIGAAAGADSAATALVAGLRARLDQVAAAVAGRAAPRVLVLEWTDPPYLAGHWVPELIRRAGGIPVGGVDGGRSTSTDWAHVAELAAPSDVVLLAPCGYDLDGAIAQADEVSRHLPGRRLLAIDSGGLVVRAGPRLVDGVEAIAAALHPTAAPPVPPGRTRWLTD